MATDPDGLKMAESMPLAVDTDTLAGDTVSGEVGDVERSSTDRRALSCQLASHIVTKSRPPGQGSGPARPAECTARPSAHAVGVVSKTTAAVAYSRPGDGSTVAHLEAQCTARTYPQLGGKCDR